MTRLLLAFVAALSLSSVPAAGEIAAIAGWPRTPRVHTLAHVLEIAGRQKSLTFPFNMPFENVHRNGGLLRDEFVEPGGTFRFIRNSAGAVTEISLRASRAFDLGFARQ